MKIKSMKTLLTVALATVMVIGSTFSVSAGSNKSGSGDAGSGSGETYTAAEQEIKEATVTPDTPVYIGGKTVTNTINSIVLAKTVQGAAVTTPKADVIAALGLKAGQQPKLVMCDLDKKKSNLAMNSINAAVEALQGTFVTALDIDLCAIEKGKKVTLKDGSIAMTMGLPKTVDTTKTYVMVCVQAKGVTTVLEDQDTNPATVTFPVQAGLGAYALVALN